MEKLCVDCDAIFGFEMLQFCGLNSGLKESNPTRNYSKRDRYIPDIYIYIYICILDDLKDRRGYCQLKEEALDLTMWRNRFGRGFGPVV